VRAVFTLNGNRNMKTTLS